MLFSVNIEMACLVKPNIAMPMIDLRIVEVRGRIEFDVEAW